MSQNTANLNNTVEMALKLSAIEKIHLVEQVMATLEQDLFQGQKTPKHSLLGIWSDVSLSEKDMDEARSDLWDNFPRNDI